MKAKRVRVARNVYRYPDGRHEVILVHAGLSAPPTRFAATVPLDKVIAWVEKARERLAEDARELGDAAEVRTSSGTLEGDAPDFFAQIAGRVSTAADTSNLRAWFDVVIDGVRLGALPWRTLTTAHINKAIGQWQSAPSPHAIRRVRVVGFARGEQTVAGHLRAAPATSGRVVKPLTIRHRCRVLLDFLRTMGGKKLAAIVEDAKIPARTRTPPPTVPMPVIVEVLEQLRTLDAKTFARFYVHATTGQRPCQIGRAESGDVDLRQLTWLVRNAKGEPAHTIYLNEQQLAAFEAFDAAAAWGPFETSEYGKLIHKAGWPKGITPYAARHSLARNAIDRGVNLGDVQALLGHADPTTTRIYAPFQVGRQKIVSRKMAPYLAGVLKPRLVRGGKR